MKIIKIGGSVITKKKEYKTPNLINIKNFARVIAKIWKSGVRDIILIHGAGSFGHPLVKEHNLEKGVADDSDRLGFAKTHQSCKELSDLLVGELLAAEVPAISIPAAAVILQTNGRIVDFSSITMEYMEHGYLPIMHGDVVPDSVIEGSVCSGDQIVSYLGKGSVALIALGTNVDGVLDDSGKIIERITRENFKEVKKHLKKVDGDVTDGMEGKITELLSLDSKSIIFNGEKPERLEDLIRGKKTICTQIIGRRK